MFIQATGTLVVVSDAADSIAIAAAAGQVLVNGASPQTGLLPASSVQAISVNGGQGANDIDLSSVTSADFTALATSGIEVHGGDGADTITASPLGGHYNGGHGDDVLIGSTGDDTLDGDDGADTLTGNGGDDLLIGEDGDDVIDGGAGADTLDGGDGADSLMGGLDDDDLSGGNDRDTLNGESGNDFLNGGFNDDLLLGSDGDDEILGGAGADTIIGGTGNDHLRGQAGNDALDGESGDDSLDGGEGNDLIEGGQDNDSLTGDSGSDTIFGDEGSDSIFAGDGADEVRGDDGSDLIEGGPDADTLFGGNGSDSIFGRAGDDIIIGNAGSDYLDGNHGDDFVGSEFPGLSINDVMVDPEGDSGSTDAVFTVSLSAPFPTQVQVSFVTANIDATSGLDYVADSGRLVFEAGETTKNINIAVLGDMLDEVDERFSVNLLAPDNATIDKGIGLATIVDDDEPPDLSIGDVTVVEGGVAVFTLTLSERSGQQINVPFSTADGTATAGTDYVATMGNVTFAVGETVRSVSVQTIDDMVGMEPNETFLVNLGSVQAANVVRNPGVGTIIDAQGQVTISIDDVTVTEDFNGSTATFTVTLSAAVASGATIDFITADQTATSGLDFVAQSGSLTFTPMMTTRTIDIPILDDSLVEDAEDFVVSLVSAVDGMSQPLLLLKPDGIGTINDNDGNRLYAVTPFDAPNNPDEVNDPSGLATSMLIEIDPTNPGNVRLIGDTQVPALIGLSNDRDGSLFSVESFGSTPGNVGIPNLYTVDPLTGGAALEFPLSGSNLRFTEGAVAFEHSTSMLWVLESIRDRIFLVDVNTGVTIPHPANPPRLNIGGVPLTGSDVSAMAFTDSELFVVIPENTPNGAQDDHLFRVDMTTLELTDVGAIATMQGPVNFDSNMGMAYDWENDWFYMAGRNNSNLYRVMPNDASATLLGPIGPAGSNDFRDVSGLTFVPAFGVIPPSIVAGSGTGLQNVGGPEDDTLLGDDGNDTLLAGAFDDSLNGGAGNDLMDGGAGNDIMEGAAGQDTLSGGDGNDQLDGGRGTDTVNGDLGNDTITWESFDGSDQTDGGFGFDELDTRTLSHNDRITVDAVGDGRFSVHHRIPSDLVGQTVRGGMIEILSIDSNGGADRITVDDLTGVQWLQQVTIDAGRGSDLVDASGQANSAILVSVQGGTGADTVIGGAGDDVTDGGMGNDVLTGGSGADTINGSDGVDKIFGSDGDDVLNGGDNRDFMYGGDGNDILSGGNQNDDLYGGTGNDLLLGDAGDDQLFGEQGNDTADGGEGDDTVSGGDGDDVLDGSAGVDSLRGGVGNDTLRGGADGDTIAGGAGDDSLLGGNGSIALLTDGNDFINGNAGNDTLLGENGHDTLLGGAGLDDLDGGFGNDQLNGNAGNDTMRGGHGDDRLRGGMGNDTLNGGHGEDKLFGQGGNDGLSGHDGHDRVNGGGGADTLHGGDGNDTLRGGAGLDLLIGHDGNDNLNGQGGDPDTLVGQDAFDILDDNGGLDVKDNDFVFVAEWIDAA